jgi:hypothetical protein
MQSGLMAYGGLRMMFPILGFGGTEMQQGSRIAFGLALLTISFGLFAAGPAEGLVQNPPPSAALNSYGTYELKELTIAGAFAGQGANEKAAAKIREHIAAQVAPIVAAWTTAGKANGKAGTVVIEPVLDQIKFIGGKTRFWAGALAGSSYVVLKLKITDSSGAVVAEPEFYQRASAMSGAWTGGGQDNDMLQRIVTLMSGYLTGNYETPVGSATGRGK